jgi:dihydrofolate reductase
MGKLIYFMPGSLDGFIGDERDGYDWSAPDAEVMTFINERQRPIGTQLYGRKNYETMAVWEHPEEIPGLSPTEIEYAHIWQVADKIVYSRTLETVATSKTRLEREFDPQMVRELKARLSHDMTISGPTLAAEAIRAGLVDEYEMLIVPVLLGRGIRILPDDVRLSLELLEERRVGDGWIYLRYRPRA